MGHKVGKQGGDQVRHISFEDEYRADHITQAMELARVANIYSEIVRRKRGDYGPDAVQIARLHLCNAIIECMDDGDAMAERECIMHDMRVDEGGNAVPAER